MKNSESKNRIKVEHQKLLENMNAGNVFSETHLTLYMTGKVYIHAWHILQYSRLDCTLIKASDWSCIFKGLKKFEPKRMFKINRVVAKFISGLLMCIWTQIHICWASGVVHNNLILKKQHTHQVNVILSHTVCVALCPYMEIWWFYFIFKKSSPYRELLAWICKNSNCHEVHLRECVCSWAHILEKAALSGCVL